MKFAYAQAQRYMYTHTPHDIVLSVFSLLHYNYSSQLLKSARFYISIMIRVALLISLSFILEGESVRNLTFMFVTSFGQFGFNASGVVPAADIALEDINNHPSVLGGYNLVYDTVRDSKVQLAVTH